MPAVLKFNDLCQLYEGSIRRHAARPLFGVRESRDWRWMTYGEIGRRVDALRATFAQLGILPGDRIALIAPNCPEWAIVAFAAFTSGAVLVPIYPYQRYDDWLTCLQDSQPRIIVTWSIEGASAVLGWRSSLVGTPTIVCVSEQGLPETMALADLEQRGLGVEAKVRGQRSKEVALLLYTSGTTGKPKGVELTHQNVASNLTALQQIFPVTSGDRSLSFLPWAHAFGQVVELYGLFAMGASMAIAPGEEEVMRSLREVSPTLLFSVPKLFNRLHDTLHERIAATNPIERKLFEDGLDNARIRRRIRGGGKAVGLVELKYQFYDKLVFQRIRAEFGGQVRYAVSGGAQLAPEVAELVDSLGITLYEGYGLTEASPIVSANWPGARRLGSVGKPLPGVRVRIDHKAGPNTRDGEIVVYGPNVMQGYHGEPEETTKVIAADGGLRTGDLGYLDADGFLFVTGRITEQYKLDNGRYVAPVPLENELKGSRFIANVMLVGDGRPHNVALIVPNLELTTEWAGEQRIRVSSNQELLSHPEVRACFGRELERCSESFRQFEKVHDFALLERDFSVDDDTATHTQKLKRRQIEKRYEREIDQMYGVHRGERRPVD